MDAADWDQRYASRELVWSADANRLLVEQVRDLPPGRALDLATGEGRNAIWLAARGWDVTAVDFSAVGLDKARDLAAQRGVDVTWTLADVTTFDAPVGQFDLVIVFYLQLPAAQRAAAHARAAAAVAPGGTLLIVGHDRDNLERGYGGPPDPAVLLDAEELASQASQAGLLVGAAQQVEREVETPEGLRTAIDVLLRAVRPDEAAAAQS